MGVYIKGMEMPATCWRCSLSQLYDSPRQRLVCKVTHEEVLRHKIDSNCPLIPVPPHGRLIDADALNDMINRSYPMTERIDVHNGYAICQEMIKQLPTIIEAEEGEE